MCLTPEALAIFLNFLAPEMITTQPGQIIVHATQADVYWVETGENWCSNGQAIPQPALSDIKPSD